MKPLFIPLKKCWYEMFLTGDKNIEYRAYGPRWNEKTCFPGREALLSNGYTNKNSIQATVTSLDVIPLDQAPEEAKDIYPNSEYIAAINLDVGGIQT